MRKLLEEEVEPAGARRGGGNGGNGGNSGWHSQSHDLNEVICKINIAAFNFTNCQLL